MARGLKNARKCAGAWVACCEAHEDNNPSLSLKDSDDGRVLVHCHAGCSQDAVIESLKARGLWPDRVSKAICHPRTDRIVAEYNYVDELGILLYQVVRLEPKRFLQRYPDGAGRWIYKKYAGQVLYRLPKVLEASTVFFVEGERDVETLRAHGFPATTTAGGANAPWLPQFTAALAGREVILIPDRDAAGFARVKRIARALLGNVARLVYLELEDGKDVSEWFERGHSELELLAQLQGEEVTR